MKIPLWQLQAMISIAHSAGAGDNWLIDFANETDKGFLLTPPVPFETHPMAPSA
jgi:hypothetical protein